MLFRFPHIQFWMCFLLILPIFSSEDETQVIQTLLSTAIQHGFPDAQKATCMQGTIIVALPEGSPWPHVDLTSPRAADRSPPIAAVRKLVRQAAMGFVQPPFALPNGP